MCQFGYNGCKCTKNNLFIYRINVNRKQYFSGTNDFRGLEEAINTIAEDSDDGLEYDLAIIPPEPSVVTDEGDDDVPPSTLPNDVPDNIEVFVRNVGTLESEDSSDDEPLAAKRSRPSFRSTQSEHPVSAHRESSSLPLWRKCSPNYSTTFEHEMMTKARAEFDYRFDKKNELLLVRWKENSICTMSTNHDSYEPVGSVKRWCNEKREKDDVSISHLFQNYNKGMGGVDELGQAISLYRIGVHGKYGDGSYSLIWLI